MSASITTKPGLRRRLRWSRDEVVASVQTTDPAVVARSFAYLFALGAGLALIVPLLPGEQLEHPGFLIATTVAAIGAGVLVLVTYDESPGWLLRGLPLFGVALVTLLLFGLRPDAVAPFVFMFFWPVVMTFFFFGMRDGFADLALVAVGSSAAIVAQDVAQGPMLWLMAMATFAATGVLMALVRSRADTLILSLDTAAKTDALTGLANRRAFDAQLDDELYRARRSGRPFALALIDIDDFKRVNDTLGHQAGDRTLQRLAELLRESRRLDGAARLGGDEFALLLPDTDVEQALVLATRFLQRVRDEAQDLGVAVSIGLASHPRDGDDAAALCAHADTALYEAKAAGGGRAVAHATAPSSS